MDEREGEIGFSAGLDAFPAALSRLLESELKGLALQTRSKLFRDYLSRLVTGGAHDFDHFAQFLRSDAPRAILHPRSASLLAQILIAQRLDHSDVADAMAIYERIFLYYGKTLLSTEESIAYADLLNQSGRSDEVADMIRQTRIGQYAGADEAALLANAALNNDGAGTDAWLSAFNSVLAVDGLEPLNLAPGNASPFDRLESTSIAASVEGPLVTVIVPTWNPGPWLWTAVRSLTQQTYANLQILVMDDHSRPEFTSQLERLLIMDSRIKVVKSARNQGTYASRNAAVRDHARGDYVTVQDDDDWSHPQRIQRQVEFSQARKLAVGIGRAARVTEDLRFVRRAATFIRRGYPTTLISRATFNELGYWDPVRRNSDFEYIRRARKSKKPVGDLGQAPLMLQRHREGSLSSSEVWEGYSDQPRRWQNWLASEWHDRSTFAGKRTYMGTGLGLDRPYAAPIGLTRNSESETPIRVHGLIIGDYGLGSGSELRALKLARAWLQEGRTVGLLHVDGLRPLAESVSPGIADLTRQSNVLIVSWGDEVVAQVAHVVDPDALILSDTVQSKVTALEAVLYDPQEQTRNAASRLLHLEFGSSVREVD